jgi:hypothetical protein
MATGVDGYTEGGIAMPIDSEIPIDAIAGILHPSVAYGDPSVKVGDKITSPLGLGPEVQTAKRLFMDCVLGMDMLCAETEEGYTLVAVKRHDG